MRSGVAQYVPTGVGIGGDDRHRSTIGKRATEVPLVAVHHGGNRRLGESRADGGSHIGSSGPLVVRALRAVGKGDGDLCHSD